MTTKQIKKSDFNRNDFLKAAGLTTAACVVPSILAGCGNTINPGVISEITAGSNIYNTDILVIGGGMAGAFAAVAAQEQGLAVTLVDKGKVGCSGSTPWANGFAVFDEEQGNDRDEWLAGVRASSEYVNNPDWLDQVMNDSKARWDDIVSWGMMGDEVRHHSLVLRDKLVDSGVTLIERTMLTTLLKENESSGSRVIGAMGFKLDNEETVVVLAKTTILCAGAGAFKAPGFPVHSLTSDGDAMAYRAGAVISGKEYVDFHFTYTDAPSSCWGQWSQMWTSIKQTNSVFTSGMTLSLAYSAHAGEVSVTGSTSTNGGDPQEGERPEGEGPGGEGPGGEPPDGERPEGGPPDGEEPGGERPEGGPLDGEQAEGEGPGSGPGESSGGPGGGPNMGGGGIVLGAATGLGIHKAEGVWPTNLQGACNVPGLFAAGDALASMLCGSSYAGPGLSLSGSAVQGSVVGQGAAEDALQVDAPSLSDEKITSLQEAMFAPRLRTTGFTPAWVTQLLQNTMFPYYVLMVKKQDRLESALSTITFLREHMVPYLIAVDAHDLRLAHETANMLINAEMKLRASLARTESRGTHYREDYPARDDENWLAWVLLQMDENGDMNVFKEEVPDEWKPDMSIPYEERYTNRFPGELAYLGLE